MFSKKILQFYESLTLNAKLPPGVEVLNPYAEANTRLLCEQFYQKFYHDKAPRKLILGINPGRLGGGMTGIAFTDPINLEKYCGIPNAFPKKAELSSTFIYQMIEAYGGVTTFYNEFFISSVCPLGFTLDGKNLNYYDRKDLQENVRDFIVASLKKHIALGVQTDVCFCLGEGQNYKFLLDLNSDYKFFQKIVPLPHPRFIMQYKRKELKKWIGKYVRELSPK